MFLPGAKGSPGTWIPPCESKALTFKAAHHFPEDWEHEKVPLFPFNEDDKRSMSDCVMSESQ